MSFGQYNNNSNTFMNNDSNMNNQNNRNQNYEHKAILNTMSQNLAKTQNTHNQQVLKQMMNFDYPKSSNNNNNLIDILSDNNNSNNNYKNFN